MKRSVLIATALALAALAASCHYELDLPQRLAAPDLSMWSFGGTLDVSLHNSYPAGTVVRYTNDGTEPTASSSEFVDTLSLPIAVGQTIVIKAYASCEGYLDSEVATEAGTGD